MYKLKALTFGILTGLRILAVALAFSFLTLPVIAQSDPQTRKEINKTLLRIKQKYQAMEDAENQPPVEIQTQAENPFQQLLDGTFVPEGRFQIGEELILSLNLGDIPLGDIFAIKSHRGIQVGLSEFSQLVDFAIDVDIDPISANGWYRKEEHSFTLRQGASNNLLVLVDGTPFDLSSEHYMVDDDIYVELSELEKWFRINSSLDESRLALVLNSAVPFPIEERLKRQGKRFTNNGGFASSVLPVKDNGYQLFSVPLLDAQLSTRFKPSSNDMSYSILSSQDAAYFSSQLFLSGNDQDALVDARLTLSRRSSEGGLLGPLDMTEYEFGDVTPVNIGVGNTSALGRGFSMNNASKRLVDNRRVNLAGEVQVGWDIELYRNGVLIDSLQSIQDGRYEFNDLELGFGANDFELVLYGPQGQIERKIESFYVDSNVVDSGQSVVQFSIVDSNRTLFGVGDFTDAPEQLGPTVSTAYDYGITDWLSVGVGASLFSPKEGENVKQYALKSNLVLGSIGLLNSVFQFDNDESRTMLHSFRTQIADIAFDLSFRRLSLLSDEARQNEQITRLDSDSINLRMSGTLFSGSLTPLNYQNNWSKSEFSSGNSTEQFQNAIGINSKWGSISNGLIWQRTSFADSAVADEREFAGSLAYKTRFGKLFTRIFSEYEIHPESEFTSVGTTLNYPIRNDLTSELRYTYNLLTKEDQYDARLNWLGDTFSFSSIASYSDKEDWSIGLTARFGLGYDKDTNTFFTSGRSLAQSGAVVVRMFEDENLDQRYNEGETLLENVNVKAVQAFRNENTDQTGLAVLKSLPSGKTTDIVVDESTFSDPSMLVTSEAFAVASRRGLVQQFDISVVKSGELDGTLYWRNESGVEQVAPYVRLSLVNRNGDAIATTRSEFDGYYLFSKILPGTYQIQVDTSSGRQRGMTPERFKQVKISNRGDLITDVDFVLRKLQFADGYVANVGEFSSLGLLRTYLQLLNERVGEKWFKSAFYFSTNEPERYVLGVSYMDGQTEESRQTTQEYCLQLQALDVRCKVDTAQFEY